MICFRFLAKMLLKIWPRIIDLKLSIQWCVMFGFRIEQQPYLWAFPRNEKEPKLERLSHLFTILKTRFRNETRKTSHSLESCSSIVKKDIGCNDKTIGSSFNLANTFFPTISFVNLSEWSDDSTTISHSNVSTVFITHLPFTIQSRKGLTSTFQRTQITKQLFVQVFFYMIWACSRHCNQDNKNKSNMIVNFKWN